MTLGHNIGAARVRSFVDRVLRLKEEQDALAADIREVYAEAKGEGFDKTALGQVVAHLRKVEKKGADAVSEAETIFDMYLGAYQGEGEQSSRTHADARTRENIEKFPPHDAETGELVDHGTPAPERKATGHARRTTGSDGANVGGDDVDRSASARPSGQSIGAEPPGVDGGIEPGIVERTTSGPDVTTGTPIQDVDFEPSDFVPKIRPISDYRPHCQKPECCASSGLKHCYACQKIADSASPTTVRGAA